MTRHTRTHNWSTHQLLLCSYLSIVCSTADNNNAAAEAYENKWANVRGVNYVPSFSANPIQTWMDYNETTVERELGFAHSLLGLNAVRVFLSLFAWQSAPDLFLARYDHFVQTCANLNIQPLVVLFDDDFFDVDGVNSTAQIAPWVATQTYRHLQWMANPGMPILQQDFAHNWTLCDAYLHDLVGGVRANDSRILGYDIMYEPHRDAPFPGGLPVFIQHVFETVGNLTTVDYTVDQYQDDPIDTETFERGLSFHNYWQYGKWQQCHSHAGDICRDRQAVGAGYFADAQQRNKPVLVSEMGQFDCYCPAAQGFRNAGVGFIMWELMLEHDQFSSFQGLIYANGTFRSEAEAKCLLALGNSNSSGSGNSTCPPSPPPAWCPSNNCTSHRDTDNSFFTWTPTGNPSGHCWDTWHSSEASTTNVHVQDDPPPTLHYCDSASGSVTFTVPPATTKALLIFKSGPDCGIMRISTAGGANITVDTYSDTVLWASAIDIPLASSAVTQEETAVTVQVLGQNNPKSSHNYVQVVGVAVYHSDD